MKRRNFFIKPFNYFLLTLLAVTLLSACKDDEGPMEPPVEEDPTGSVTVTDQYIAETDNMIVVDEVTLSHDGWVVVHRDNGSNGPVVPDIISEPEFLTAGTHNDVMLALQEGEEVETEERLWVMLHDDTGETEVYEFDGSANSEDQPVADTGGDPVMASLINNYTYTESTENTMYPLYEVDGSAVSGMATFYRAARGDGAYVVLDLEGTPEEGMHPAHIHVNSAEEGGGIAISLSTVDGSSGESITFVNRFDEEGADRAGEAVTYDELLAYNGYINVHESPENLGNVVAQGNIGENASALTGESKEYALNESAVEGIDGTATFWELEDGSAFVRLRLGGTPEEGNHPAHIHVNSAAEGGGIAISLSPVNGRSGQSFTFVNMFDEGSPDRAGEAVTYAELLEYNGYINVHLSPEDLGTIVAQGDIGGNELTGESAEYSLASTDEATDVNGTVTLRERMNGNTLVEINVDNTVAGMEHPAHIHEGEAGSGGGIAISLNPVNGDSGMSITNVRAFDGADMEMNAGDPVSFTELLEYNGYVNVHLSAEDLATVVASGNIGANAND